MEKTSLRKIKDKEIKELILAAIEAGKSAYAPYSNYLVGAAVLSDKGNIYKGCNVETATFSQTTHAERAAIVAMVANGERQIKALCCAAENGGIPCAECRQVIWEFSGNNPDIKIIGVDSKKNVTIFTIGELYPYPFGPADLNINPQTWKAKE